MLQGLKDIIKEANSEIKKETIKLNKLHKEIDEYETLICIVGQTGSSEQVMYFKQKINNCYTKIDMCLENISSNKDRIATMRAVNKIVKRGEKSA